MTLPYRKRGRKESIPEYMYYLTGRLGDAQETGRDKEAGLILDRMMRVQSLGEGRRMQRLRNVEIRAA